MTKPLTYVLLLLVALSSPAAASERLNAQVVNVMTGDMLIVSIDHRAEVVHLYGVDCPERGETGWIKARDYTEQMVLYKQVVVEPVGAQRAGTIQAKVYVGDRCINDALASTRDVHKYIKSTQKSTSYKGLCGLVSDPERSFFEFEQNLS